MKILLYKYYLQTKVTALLFLNSKLSRWQKYGKFLNKYANCLDGSYAEAVQNISENALANDWRGFISFIKKSKPANKVLINIESGFLQEMGTKENLKKIKKMQKNNVL